MIIGNQTAIYSQYQEVQQPKIPPKDGSELPSSAKVTKEEPKGLDMRNISSGDIRDLAKATGDDRVWQFIPFEKFEFDGSTLKGVENKDYLGFLERRIEYKNSIGEPTTNYEEILSALKSYQGYILPPKIDVRA